MRAYLWVSLGAILGANLRYFLSRLVARSFHHEGVVAKSLQDEERAPLGCGALASGHAAAAKEFHRSGESNRFSRTVAYGYGDLGAIAAERCSFVSAVLAARRNRGDEDARQSQKEESRNSERRTWMEVKHEITGDSLEG